ncbi:hypothetical protein NDU88_007225 [Pleurodeles waltl]|uniref:Uncharacterized protein n=1 Tax=Pleurodeles waltl TaxID=8319 RepID=A0AAV7RUF1_PLEWA|nr:hypothetical protein NDU88_007225 [Pleurodeles waltl]
MVKLDILIKCAKRNTKKFFTVKELELEEDSDEHELMENVAMLVAIINKEEGLNQPKCSVRVNRENIEMLVDTGSIIALLSKDAYNNLECKTPLEASRILPGTYTGHKIKQGVFKADLSYKEISVFATVLVVYNNVNILGWLEQQKLRKMLNTCQPPYVFNVQEDCKQFLTNKKEYSVKNKDA